MARLSEADRAIMEFVEPVLDVGSSTDSMAKKRKVCKLVNIY